ncbi:hypothetical protein CYLTODRAFT_417906 [Cylindrobasidium torrendii FP15055 ss-10]|uniref:Mitochondrial outer membrane protein IML2 n=1 Tax=Cylindrobasidium torrendii FP15055 ss-10 TaxID=1314674 RepID=A0A0D7BPN5_9AGAR|nr:hypothetical protein CYLTODRAFT_417906 [Cylindrobasidium torrendii FP15055 ss-10]
MSTSPSSEALLVSATTGFDQLFANDLEQAKETFKSHLNAKSNRKEEIAFHQLGLGVAAFLEAAFGMEKDKMEVASQALNEAVTSSAAALKSTDNALEYEILHADAILLAGLVSALGETYMGYLSCLYALNNAHGKFTKLYKAVFPNGLEGYKTPSATPAVSRKPSLQSIASTASTSKPPARKSFFSRITGSTLAVPSGPPPALAQGGPVAELVIAGTAFGFGLFNLVFSLLPKGVQSVVGFFGFKHDRKLALEALGVAANRTDVHGVFSGLVLMTYYGVVLLLSGWQANEALILKRYKGVVDRVQGRYPTGTLWVLNRAKILRMAGKSKEAIQVIEEGLKVDSTFRQADTLLVFEYAWLLLAERQYEEAGKQFIRMTELNSWSHPTYIWIACGCSLALGDEAKAKEHWDKLPDLVDQGKKVGGKDLPVEVMIRKKLEFYREKAARRNEDVIKVIKISPAEEMAIFWNTHQRIPKDVADAHILEWASLTPKGGVKSAYIDTILAGSGKPASTTIDDLDTPDELALRSLLLGVVMRTVGEYDDSLALLRDASGTSNIKTSTWITGVSTFEEAVTLLWQADKTAGEDKAAWEKVLKQVETKLDKAMAVSGSATDLSSRLDSRVAMLKDELASKKEKLGIA